MLDSKNSDNNVICKRILIVFFGAVLALLGIGCAGKEYGKPDALLAVSEPGNTLVDYDANRQIYILCENVYSDVYLESYAGVLNFYIFTRERIEKEKITVTIPVRNSYEIFISDSVDCRLTQAMIHIQGRDVEQNGSVNAFPYYLYQCYKDVDIEMIGALAADTLHDTKDPEYSADWKNLLNVDIESFRNLGKEQIPEFYAYQIYAVIHAGSDKVPETFESIEVTIEDRSYTKKIGQVNLHAGKIPTHVSIGSLQDAVVQQFYTHAVGTTQQMYSDGIGYEYLLEFSAPENLTLSELRILDKYTEVLDIELTLTKQDSTSTTFCWDGKSPVQVLKGQKLGLTLYYRNANMANLWYTAEMCVEVDYAMGSETACVFLRRTLYPIGINLHEAYAVIFAGLDMESYYRHFYYPVYEPWMQKYRTIE